MQVIEVWEIYEWDGGELTIPRGKFLSNEASAKEYKQKHPADCIAHKVLMIADTPEELVEVETKRVRQAALAKLSPLERQVLGLEK
jgi:hypothetical protein